MKSVPITLGDYTEKNARLLRILNEATLPVQYADRFYAQARPEWTRYGIVIRTLTAARSLTR